MAEGQQGGDDPHHPDQDKDYRHRRHLCLIMSIVPLHNKVYYVMIVLSIVDISRWCYSLNLPKDKSCILSVGGRLD